MSRCAESKVPVKQCIGDVRFEVFTTVTMKNVVFWDVAPCRFRFTQDLHGAKSQNTAFFNEWFFFIWFVRLLALRPLLAYCASLG
jgi:hypothetical protein